MLMLGKYLCANGLTVNLNKTYHIHFRSRQRQIDTRQLSQIKLYERPIELRSEVKLLGIILDEYLDWRSHTMNLRKDLSRISGMLYKLKNILPQRPKQNIYYSLMHSRIMYGIVTWGKTASSNLSSLQRVQNMCLKSIFRLPNRFPTISLFQQVQHGMLSIKAIHTFETILMVYKIRNNMVASNISFVENLSQYSSRNPHQLRLPSITRTNYGIKRFSYLGPHIFNTFLREIGRSVGYFINMKINKFKFIVRDHIFLLWFPI